MNTRLTFKSLLYAGACAIALTCAVAAHASVVIAATRLVYNQKESEVTVRLTNAGQSPALVQAWIDKGDPKAAPASIDVPFTVTPPVSRIDPGKGQTLRIFRMGEPAAKDHESVYWLNVLEIPPEATGEQAGDNKLQLAFRTRIKLFYRPDGLQGRAEEAPAQLTWRLTTKNGHSALESHNPTAYSVSLTGVDVTNGGKTAVFDDGVMILPGETKALPLKGFLPGSAASTVRYKALNDYGGTVQGETPAR